MSSPTSSANIAVGSGVSFVAALTTAVLFVLQLSGVIHVSWWLVFAPVLVCFGFGILAAIALLGVMVAVAMFSRR